jgi:hypothetical protein
MISIRASSLPELFDCPARWEAKHILGKRLPASGATQLGTAIHAGAAAFDVSRINDTGLTVDEAAAAVVDAIYKPEFDVQWDEEKPAEAEKIGIALHRKYCTQISPVREYVAVEIRCDSLEITDLGITLTGTIDRLRVTDNGYGITDIKSGKTAVSASGVVNTSAHGYQLGAYELMAECASGLRITEKAEIIGVQTGKTDKAQRIGTGEISGTREMLLGDGDTHGVLEMASKIIHSGSFYGNPRSMLCSEKFCPIFKQCKFKL